ncbi:MAG: threonine synthase [Planctomycetes bacterium]|nr:threonine synthase [Planctomycetota bacterium]
MSAQFVSYVRRLRCINCDATYAPDKVSYTCPSCGVDEGLLDVEYDMDAVARDFALSDLLDGPQNHWRYGPLLPVTAHHIGAQWPIGWTPLVDSPLLAKLCGVGRLRLKDDSRNASGSFKDRASSIGVVRAAEAGAKAIACASTGNAAVSLAACSAMASMPAYIFVSQRIPEGKLAQLLIYGATVFRVQGTYDDAYRLCASACEAFGWYNRNCAFNPYLVEGKKTGGLEIAEQCMSDPPDWVSMSVGDGCSIAGVAKGLRQMAELELIDWSTRLLGVQAEGVAPIQEAFETGTLGAGEGDTFADSINCPVPRNWKKAVRAVRDSQGAFTSVSDDEIRWAMREVGRLAGIFAEPAAATAVAGVAKAVRDGILNSKSSVVAYISGNGLKDVPAAISASGSPIDIMPELEAVTRVVES